jgi:hypothetical protein
MARLNRKRFALSLAIIGAIVTPIWTGSLNKAHAWHFTFEDDQTRYLTARGMKPYSCYIAGLLKNYDVESEPKICSETENLVGKNVIQKSEFYPSGLVPLTRDLLLGFLTPFLLVLLVPRLARAYLRWVTKPANLT